MKNVIAEKYTISPFFVFFLMYASMVEVGVLYYQRDMIQHAGYNAWISVLLTGISVHLIVWMIYKILSSNEEARDILAVNQQCFGRIIGNALNLGIVVYFFLGAFTTFRGYMAVIQIWLFPDMSMLPLSIMVVILITIRCPAVFDPLPAFAFGACSIQCCLSFLCSSCYSPICIRKICFPY